MIPTNCGLLSAPIRAEIANMANEAVNYFTPQVTVKEALRFCVKPAHLAAYRLVSRLSTRDTWGITTCYGKFPVDTEIVKDFIVVFQCQNSHPDMTYVPTYAVNSRTCIANKEMGRVFEKVYTSVLHAYDWASRMRVVLHVFDELDQRVESGRTIVNMRYHLDWLPLVMDRIWPWVERESSLYKPGKKTGDKYKEAMARKRQWLTYRRLLDNPRAADFWHIPYELRQLVPFTSRTIASLRIMQMQERNKRMPEVQMIVPKFYHSAVGYMDFPKGMWVFGMQQCEL